MNNSENPGRLIFVVVLLVVIAIGRIVWQDPTSENGYKPARILTREEEQQELDARIKIIEDNPNIPAYTKQRVIAQMRAMATSPPPSSHQSASLHGS